MEPKDVFARHYNGLPNPLTPVVLSYGWIDPDRLAYELATDEAQVRFALTVVALDEDGFTSEKPELRQVGRNLADMMDVIKKMNIDHQSGLGLLLHLMNVYGDMLISTLGGTRFMVRDDDGLFVVSDRPHFSKDTKVLYKGDDFDQALRVMVKEDEEGDEA